jgi:hypothetical protein
LNTAEEEVEEEQYHGYFERALMLLQGAQPKKTVTRKVVDLTPEATLTKSSRFIINQTLETAVRESYARYTTGGTATDMGNAPLYIVVFGKVEGGHASILYYVDGILYSLGLGYLGGKEGKTAERISSILGGQIKANACLYSPDYLIAPWDGKEDAQGNIVYFKYDIADVGILQPAHLDRIKEFIAGAKREFTIGMKPAKFRSPSKGDFYRYKFKTFYIDLNKTYNMISTKKLGVSGNNINCTTFAEAIFQERLACPLTKAGITMASFASHPLSCRSTVLANPRETFKQYMQKYITGGAIGELYNQLYTPIEGTNAGNENEENLNALRARRQAEQNAQKGFLRKAYNCTLGKFCPLRDGGKRKTRRVKKRKGTRRVRKH